MKNDFDKFSFDSECFNSNKFIPKTKSNDENNNSFDPFDSPGEKKETVAYFGFDSDFGNFETFNDTGNIKDEIDGVWGEKIDEKNVRKIKEYNQHEVKKFNGNFSDNFDRDLELGLKRSLMEQ